MEDNCPSFCPILSAIGTPTYDLAKFLVPILKPLTENEYTVHDSFSFPSEVSKFNSKNLMASLDVESLFTNIPLEETIDNIINYLFLTTDKVHNFEREELKKLLFFLQHINPFLFLMDNITLKLMALLWDPLWVQHLLMLFCVISKKSGFQNALQNFYQMFTKDMLMTFL